MKKIIGYIKSKKFIDTFFIMIASIAVGIALYSILSINFAENKSDLFSINDRYIKKINILDARIDNLATRLYQSEIRQDSVYFQVDSLELINVYISKLNATQIEIETINSKISKFEKLFLSDAENLITLPLLIKDIENIDTGINSLKEEVDIQSKFFQYMHNQTKWIMGTLALGLIAVIIRLFRQ